LRKEEQLFRSRNFHFPNTVKNDRVIEYIKLDEWGNKLEVLLNCSEGSISIEDGGEILFSHLYSHNNRLLENGVLIRRIQ
jgi:cyclomaltodextrinase / maltogenic alpha-amylase / neopullulanase